jgi:hypothetical protein
MFTISDQIDRGVKADSRWRRHAHIMVASTAIDTERVGVDLRFAPRRVE